MVDNEVRKSPPKKRNKNIYGPATRQTQTKIVKQNKHGPDESTDEEENIVDYSSDDNLESSVENEAELEKHELVKELWKDEGKFNFSCNNFSVINHEHTMARIVSASQWVISLY